MRKLIVLVEFKEEDSSYIKSLLQELNYDGETKCFAELSSAITFLESVRCKSGVKLDHADLIL